MNYGHKRKEKLSLYKSTYYPELADGIWKNNKRSYAHILPEANKFDNLLPTYRDSFIAYLNKHSQIELHSDFHHLNSSQAMCFNFFFPLFEEQKLEWITEFLGLKNVSIDYNTACFEKDGIEARFGSRPTSFDFYFETTGGEKLHFEIKYTEADFGKAAVNAEKFDAVYSKFLQPLHPVLHTSENFYKNYQILRNLIHIDNNSFVIFIYPQQNYGVGSGVERVKSEFLVKNYHHYFRSVTWENLVDHVSHLAKDSRLETQFQDFEIKYLQ